MSRIAFSSSLVEAPNFFSMAQALEFIYFQSILLFMDLLHEMVVDDPNFSSHTSISVMDYSLNQRFLTAEFESSQVSLPFKILVYP